MSHVIDLARFRQSKRPVAFSRAELSLITGVYSRQVARGVWRDYAIDHLDGLAMFSVFRHAHDQPLFAILKLAGRSGKPPDFALAVGPTRLARSRSLSEILDALNRKIDLVNAR